MATAKKVTGDYNVVLTLSSTEARYISVLVSRVWGIRPVNDIWTTLETIVGEPDNLTDEPTFNYESLSRKTRNWVENGE